MQNAENEQLFQKISHGPSVFARIHSYRDGGTYADEWLMLFKVLLPISGFFTLGFGFALHYNMTLPYLGDYGAKAFAFLFTLFIELAKLFAGLWVLRIVWFGLYKHGWSASILGACGLAIALGAFWWSFYNSTQGVDYLAHYVGEYKVERQTVDLAATTADVDNRIGQSQSTAQKGLGIKWNGTTTQAGQKIALHSAAAISEQEKQRTILLQQGAERQQQLDEHRGTFITSVAGLLSKLGGKMEWFQLFILCGMVSCEKALWDRMTRKAPSPTQAKQSTQPRFVYNPNGHKKSVPIHNGNHIQNRIGFNIGADGNVMAANPPQSHPPAVYHNVSQQNAPRATIGADAIIKSCQTRIMADIANLKRGNGKPRTVARRIFDAIEEVGRGFETKGFDPNPKKASEFYVYMRDLVFPVLDEHKRPYEYQEPFMNGLVRYTDPKVTAELV